MFASLACNSLRRNKKTEASININMIVGPGGASPEVTRVTRSSERQSGRLRPFFEGATAPEETAQDPADVFRSPYRR